MAYLRNLATDLRTRGEARFFSDYPTSSVLIGVGILGVLESASTARIVVGRTSDADVVVPELSISTEHCAFEATPFGLRVIDIGSTNGTFLEGHRLAQNEAMPMRSGAKLILGRFEFQYWQPKDFLTQVRKYSINAKHDTEE